MAYGDFKDLPRRTASDKVLRNKAFNISKTPKYNGYQRDLASMVYKFFHKKAAGSGVNNEIKQNERPLDLVTQQLPKELHKPVIKKFKKGKVYPSFKDNIPGADLADMQLIKDKKDKKIKKVPVLLMYFKRS